MPVDPDTILTIYLCVWLALAGATMGSFLDCAAWRWAREERMFRGRSRCAACGHTLAARDLVPILSYVAARGKCRHCGEQIPMECLWAELAGSAVFVCFGLRFGTSLELCQWLVLGALLLAVSLADAAKRLIPGSLLLAMAANRVVWALVLQEPLPEAGKAALISLCAVPLPLLALTLLMEHVRGREMMGGGDIKLLGAMALYLEWPQMILLLLLGCLSGILGAAVSGKKGAFAFGPYLAAAGVAVACFGSPLVEWYLGLLAVP